MADIIIIGGGAAGLFAAASACREGHDVTLLEKMPSVGRKLLITGKGRCNLTNNCTSEEFLNHVKCGAKFLYSSLYRLPPTELMEMFEQEGLALKTERGNRVFPQSDRSKDVLATLLKMCEGVNIRCGCDVSKLIVENAGARGVELKTGEKISADAVIIATGGLSYPGTGSTGDGHRLLKSLGHRIQPTRPSLVGLRSPDKTCAELMGLSLKNVSATLFVNDKQVFKEQGEMLFTHFGVSGPLILSASCELPQKYRHAYVSIDFKPALDEQTLSARIDEDIIKLGAKSAGKALDALLPKKLIPIMLSRWGIDITMQANGITRAKRQELITLLKDFRVEIDGTDGMKHAVITEGGVSLDEVNPKTMESKLVKNLYIVGELLDVSAVTGGFNLHIAFCTANAAANAIYT